MITMEDIKDYLILGLLKDLLKFLLVSSIIYLWKKYTVNILKTMKAIAIFTYTRIWIFLSQFPKTMYVIRKGVALMYVLVFAYAAFLHHAMSWFYPVEFLELKISFFIGVGLYFFWFIDTMTFTAPPSKYLRLFNKL